MKPAPSNRNLTVCGNKCNSIADCGGSEDAGGFDCSCALPSGQDARRLGLDPVAPIAFCLALYKSSLGISQLGGKRNVLGERMEMGYRVNERGVSAYVDKRGVPYTCRCNETFVGDACCRSRNGIVHFNEKYR